MICKMRLVFDVYPSFSQVFWKKVLHDSQDNTLPPLRCMFSKRQWCILTGNRCIHKKTSIPESFFFFDKVKLQICNLIKSESSAQMFTCEICKICTNTFFQNTTGRLLLIISVSIVVKGDLANETVNYDTKTKAFILI